MRRKQVYVKVENEARGTVFLDDIYVRLRGELRPEDHKVVEEDLLVRDGRTYLRAYFGVGGVFTQDTPESFTKVFIRSMDRGGLHGVLVPLDSVKVLFNVPDGEVFHSMSDRSL